MNDNLENQNNGLSDELLSKIEKLAKDAILLKFTDEEVFTRLGGKPLVPADFSWPKYNDNPLSFIGQIKFSEVNAGNILPDYPDKGLMYVFIFDDEETPWGFDPKDKGGWRIIFYEDETLELNEHSFPEGIDEDAQFDIKYLKGKKIKTYPCWENENIEKLELDDNEFELYEDMKTAFFGDEDEHVLGGYANPIQSADMDLECQLVSNGLFCGNETGYQDPRAKELEKGRGDWQLLLQIDSDDDAYMMWGDSGMLYFWIKKDDLKNRNFDDVWMILQCC